MLTSRRGRRLWGPGGQRPNVGNFSAVFGREGGGGIFGVHITTGAAEDHLRSAAAGSGEMSGMGANSDKNAPRYAHRPDPGRKYQLHDPVRVLANRVG